MKPSKLTDAQRASLFGGPAPAPIAAPKRRRGAAAPEPDAPALDVVGIGREAAQLGPGLFGFLLAVDARIVASGGNIPPISPWWRWTLGAWYASGRLALIVEAGRGSGKSTTLEKVALTETLFGERVVPAGQRFLWPFVSVTLPDAKGRIEELAACARALGIDAHPTYPSGQPTLELVDARGQSVSLVALASNVNATSGKTTIGGTIDEEQKLRGADNANPSREVLASLIQTFRSAPRHLIRCSSTWAEGTHSAAIAEGTTDRNFVATIGEAFLEPAIAGCLAVAAWEEKRGNAHGAKRVRDHALALTADDPRVPAFVCNPTIGAVQSREQIDMMPAAVTGGLSRTDTWLREIACVSTRGAAMAAEQCIGLGPRVREVIARTRWSNERTLDGGTYGRPVASYRPMPHPLAPPGDPRYAGPSPRRRPVL